MSFYLAAAISFAFFVGLVLWRYLRQPSGGKRIETFKRRLRDYAAMKEGTAPQVGHGDLLLSTNEHAILLGILKKVEAKNGVMATIWSLLITGVIAATFTAAFSNHADSRAFSATGSLFILMISPFLITSIIGTRQIDNFLMGPWKDNSDPCRSALLLQIELMEDALIKEDLLWTSQRAAVLLAFILPVLAVSYLWI